MHLRPLLVGFFASLAMYFAGIWVGLEIAPLVGQRPALHSCGPGDSVIVMNTEGKQMILVGSEDNHANVYEVHGETACIGWKLDEESNGYAWIETRQLRRR